MDTVVARFELKDLVLCRMRSDKAAYWKLIVAGEKVDFPVVYADRSVGLDKPEQFTAPELQRIENIMKRMGA